jgi:hypothetical protein
VGFNVITITRIRKFESKAMWTSTKDMENANGCDRQGKQETCTYRNDRQRQAGCDMKKSGDRPSYVSSPAMSAIDIYPY